MQASHPSPRSAPRPRYAVALALGTLCLCASAPPAAAADCSEDSRLGTCIDADSLWPHAGAGRLQSVGATETTAPAQFAFGLVASYLRKPIVLRAASPNPDGTDIPAVDHMVNGAFLWSLGLTERLELTLAMPVTFQQTGTGVSGFTSSRSTDLPNTSLRDFRFGAAYALVPRPRAYPGGLFALTSRLEIAAPTGDEDWFGGDRSAVAIPSIAADLRAGRAFAGLELGARVRKTTNLAGARVGTQGFVALGAGYDVLPRELLSVALEAFALPTFVNQEKLSRDPVSLQVVAESADAPLIPAEWMATLRSAPTADGDVSFALSGGSALPLTESPVTAPLYRFVAAIRFAPLARDTDADGVLDRDDQCPEQVEDRDGFEDEDGCVDADNDRDGVPDEADRCRDKAEDNDGFEDSDGCPELDDDKDGVPDKDDACRFKPEDKDNFEDTDGCPDPDNDQDGIPDEKDACPNAAEDMDGYNDTDGCPDPDNDADGIEDSKDQCPTSAEDKDSFRDEDGCPDLDNDEDGVPDSRDRCPTEAETINGTEDADGCPEAGAKDETVVNGASVAVLTPQRFQAGSARISPALRKQLVMMVQRALGQQPLQMIVVQTYADRPGYDARSEALAADRADAIREVLLAEGLSSSLLTAASGDLAAKRDPRSPQFEISVQKAPQK